MSTYSIGQHESDRGIGWRVFAVADLLPSALITLRVSPVAVRLTAPQLPPVEPPWPVAAPQVASCTPSRQSSMPGTVAAAPADR